MFSLKLKKLALVFLYFQMFLLFYMFEVRDLVDGLPMCRLDLILDLWDFGT